MATTTPEENAKSLRRDFGVANVSWRRNNDGSVTFTCKGHTSKWKSAFGRSEE